MSIPVRCPRCGRTAKAPDEAVGKKARCQGCRGLFVVELAQPSHHETEDGDQPSSPDDAELVPSRVRKQATSRPEPLPLRDEPTQPPPSRRRLPWLAGATGVLLLAGLGAWLLTRGTGKTGTEAQQPNNQVASAAPPVTSPPNTNEKGKSTDGPAVPKKQGPVNISPPTVAAPGDPTLDGEWTLGSLYLTYTGGEKSSLSVSTKHKFSIKGTVLEVAGPINGKQTSVTYTLEIDSSAKPKRFKQTNPANADDSKSVVYRVDKDTLLVRTVKFGKSNPDWDYSGIRISSSGPGSDADIPEGFLLKPGEGGGYVFEFRRAKLEK